MTPTQSLSERLRASAQSKPVIGNDPKYYLESQAADALDAKDAEIARLQRTALAWRTITEIDADARAATGLNELSAQLLEWGREGAPIEEISKPERLFRAGGKALATAAAEITRLQGEVAGLRRALKKLLRKGSDGRWYTSQHGDADVTNLVDNVMCSLPAPATGEGEK